MLSSVSLNYGLPIDESVKCKSLQLLNFNFMSALKFLHLICRDPEFVFYDRPDTTMFAYR